MKQFLRTSVLATALLAAPVSLLAQADIMGDIVKAQVMIGKVQQVIEQIEKVQQLTVDLQAPRPMEKTKGKFLLPYTIDGEPTEWAQKALNAQAGKLVGEKAGNMAANALASKVPFSGLAGGFMKKKVKESAAVLALGGMDFIKETSDQSFNKIEDYAVFLQARHGRDPDFKEMLASAVAVYPDLEHRFAPAVQAAYRKQMRGR